MCKYIKLEGLQQILNTMLYGLLSNKSTTNQSNGLWALSYDGQLQQLE